MTHRFPARLSTASKFAALLNPSKANDSRSKNFIRRNVYSVALEHPAIITSMTGVFVTTGEIRIQAEDQPTVTTPRHLSMASLTRLKLRKNMPQRRRKCHSKRKRLASPLPTRSSTTRTAWSKYLGITRRQTLNKYTRAGRTKKCS